MTVDQARRGRPHPRTAATAAGEGSATRQRILEIALSLMSQRGVDGTSMRDLAAAAGLNVASLYHYFPSKRDLLEAVLVEEGILPYETSTHQSGGPGHGSGAGAGAGSSDQVGPGRRDGADAADGGDGTGRRGGSQRTSLSDLLAAILGSMFDVEDFVRLMVSEAMRGEATARAVGLDLFASFETSITEWVAANRPDLDERAGTGSVSRLLSAMVVGIFIQHAAGVLDEEDLAALSRRRAGEAAEVLASPG